MKTIKADINGNYDKEQIRQWIRDGEKEFEIDFNDFVEKLLKDGHGVNVKDRTIG